MIHHVGVEVAPEDLERSVALLASWSASPRSSRRRAWSEFTWLERGGTQIHLLPTESPTVPTRGHVAVVAPDFEAAVAALRGAGFEVERRSEYWGAPRAKARPPAATRSS